jgi:hypothetical protein
MSSIKEVKRTSGDWHVQSEQDIHLETQYAGNNNGTVYVWGNLNVIGNTTSIESNDLSIGDKILILNKGEPGLVNGTQPGVSADGISGLSIERGGPASPNANANLVFNQSKNWSYAGITTQGMWEALIGPPTGGIGEPSGLIVAAIRTGSANKDLSLLGAENPNATVTLLGVTNYTQRIVNRDIDDDIPNKGYVDYAIETQLDRRRIQLNFRNAQDIIVTRPETNLEFVDSDVPGFFVSEPQLNLTVGGNQWVTFFNNRAVIGDFKITDGNELTMQTSDVKMILSTTAGPSSLNKPSVEIHSSLSLKIDNIYQEPLTEVNNIKIYSKTIGPGNSGIFFVNSEGIRDELPSKRKSFFTSLMF